MDSHKILTLFLSVVCCISEAQHGSEPKCWDSKDPAKRLTLSVVSHLNETGKWLSTFNAFHESEKSSVKNNITVDVSQSVTECEGMRRIRITGFIAEDIPRVKEAFQQKHRSGVLLFDLKCGTNVAVVENGRTVQKINLENPLDSVVFTIRPLKDDEIFEVRLDKKHTKFTHSLGIGVTTHPPKKINISNHINHLPHPTWAMYHGHLYQNGSLFFRNYGTDLNTLVVGDRVGVMRSSAGNIHYYVNGVDQGPAASNVPFPVYGVLELWNNAARATIIPSS